MAKSFNGTYYCVYIQFDTVTAYYNGKPSHHVYHSYTKLGAKKWKTAAGAHRAMAKVPKIPNQTIFVGEV